MPIRLSRFLGTDPAELRIRGVLDLATSYRGRILVEIKKSDNPKLLHGFEMQLPAYERSEATEESLYLIMRVTESEFGIKDVLALREKRKAEGKRVPEVVVIDARFRLSASKRRTAG